ncbi:transglycosylase SLT domain-containing protein [Aestuariivirga sp.]|uniref:transglycosylase SLT domain-containing protein n=1 Tax=Aestuariivirga sp. TaxID=2650926 RepID=UPI003592ED3D
MSHSRTKTKAAKSRSVRQVSVQSKKRVHAGGKARKSASLRRTSRSGAALAIAPARSSTAARGRVVSLIQSMAPAQGVPTWFALRIAHVESNYNSHLRGAAGEYGVFQIKCATAKGIGFRGNCGALLDARTNVQWGLKHLSLAMKSSGGNLRLAASKHNGGLGRKTEVRSYVAKVF